MVTINDCQFNRDVINAFCKEGNTEMIKQFKNRIFIPVRRENK